MEQDDRPLDAPRDLAELTALIRRVVSARVSNRDAVDDIVQETVARLLAMKDRLDGRAVGPYAVVTARNLVASQWRGPTRQAPRAPAVRPTRGGRPDESSSGARRRTPCGRARAPDPRERDVLVAHEVEGQDTRSLGRRHRLHPGCGAAQLARSRAKLRVEYLIELDREPPTPQCRPVLVALSAATAAGQAELDAGYHLLDCDYCAALSQPLFDRRSPPGRTRCAWRWRPTRHRHRPPARARHRLQAGFSATEATMIATAISEIARNIVRFARRGDVTGDAGRRR
jgi:serine/threonine-protein kinase RsbT